MRSSPHKFIGKCIYCGTIEGRLTNEHTIPLSLGGDKQLLKASCEARCNGITSAIEGHVTGGAMKQVRTMMDIKTRRKKDRPKDLPMAMMRGDEREIEFVPVDDYIGVMPYIERGMPGYLLGNLHPAGLGVDHVKVEAISVMRRTEEHLDLARKYDTEYLAVDFPLKPETFGRMIAKVAYCHAVWNIGLNQWQEVFVLPAILGERDDIWHWVGSEGRVSADLIKRPRHGSYHLIKFWVDHGLALVSVQLFANGGLPEYLVVVGRVSEALRGLFFSVGVRNA